MSKRKDLNYYLALPYTIQIAREDETTWFARVVELPSCMTEGDTPEEAADMNQFINVALAGRVTRPATPKARPIDAVLRARVAKTVRASAR
jgi:hypothetical protein